MPVRPSLGLSRHQWQWALLVAASLLLSAAFDAIGLPAGRLLGPMVAAIVFALRGASLAVAIAQELQADAARATA